MKLFDDKRLSKEVILNEGDKLIIPANQYHIHSNSSDEKSLTSWKFEGNIISVIENIRNSFKKIL
jgi:gentisate 1,2-dioxygenase